MLFDLRCCASTRLTDPTSRRPRALRAASLVVIGGLSLGLAACSTAAPPTPTGSGAATSAPATTLPVPSGSGAPTTATTATASEAPLPPPPGETGEQGAVYAPVLTYADVDGAGVVIGAGFVPAVIAGGTCILTVTDASGRVVTAERDGMPDAQSTQCGELRVEGVASGRAVVALRYVSAAGQGTSNTMEVVVP